jgi:hypothetical protein
MLSIDFVVLLSTNGVIGTLSLIDVGWLVFVSFLGALLGAIIAWLEATGNFDWKKFLASLLKGMVTALVFVLAYQTAKAVYWYDFIAVFVSSAGFDALLKRGQNGIERRRLRRTTIQFPHFLGLNRIFFQDLIVYLKHQEMFCHQFLYCCLL